MTKFCTTCGTPLEEGAAFCTECGSAVQAASTSPEDEALAGAGSANAVQPGSGTPAGAGAIPDATMTIPAQEAPIAAPAPMPAASMTPPPASTTPPPASMTPATFAPATQPMQQQTMQPAMGYPGQQAAPADNRKTWLIVGIAAAAIVVIAAVVIAFVVMGGNGNNAKYRVTFETTGGTPVASSEVADGTSINEPASPTRTDYRFDGWYLDSTYTSKVVFPYTVNEDTVLYAKWAEENTSVASTSTSTSTSGNTSSSNNTSGTTSTNNSSSTKSVSITGSDGSTRNETIHRSGSSERIFPDSNSRALTQSEVNRLSDAEKCIAWNEIIAASNGYVFKNSGLREYFNSCSWYHPDPNASGSGNLSSTASANVEMLKNSCNSWWLNLATY